MKNLLLTIFLVLSIVLASCTASEPSEISSEEVSYQPSSLEMPSEEISEQSEESSEESIEEESEEPSEEVSIPEDASELYLYAMSLIENSEGYTAITESAYDLFQSDEPEPVLSYTASTEIRLQEVNEHDKRLDFYTKLSIDGIESKSELLYIDGTGYYDTDGEKIKQEMSFEKMLEFLGSENFAFSPDMFGKIKSDDLRGGKRIELTEIIDMESASSLIPDNMENGKIEDLRVTLYVNDDGTPAAEIIGMRLKIESDHKKIEIHCEVIQTTTFSNIGSTVVKSDINPNDYTDGIIYRN